MANFLEQSSDTPVDHYAERTVQGDAKAPSTGLSDLDAVQKEAVIRHETAAVEVQRLYRGYRARRSIADAATMAHKFGWWNVLEGALLQYNSSQFYAYNAPQNAAQRWLRLKKKAAKVGKGLSKNEEARKLAIQHWLEAIDPRHRYGHNLHFYYVEWHSGHSQEPFFYWLDLGEGKDLDLEECKRKKLQKELIRYLSPKERKWYEVVIEDGKLVYKMTWEPVNTPKGDKWIFVMSTTGKLYVGKKEKGKLQHSSFLAGGATTAAGRLLVHDGIIQLMEAHSGHYHPTQENFHQLVNILTRSGADLTIAKVQCVSDDMLGPSFSLTSKAMDGYEETTETVPIVFKDVQKEENRKEDDSLLELKCSEGFKEMPTERVPVVCEDVQKEDCPPVICKDMHKEENKKEDGSVQELEFLSLGEEKHGSITEKVTLDERRGSQFAHDSDNLEVESSQIPWMGSSTLDQHEGENLQGMSVEIIEVIKSSLLSQNHVVALDVEESTSKLSCKLAPETLPTRHKLFSPAMRTFSQLQGGSSLSVPGLHEAECRTATELPPNAKLILQQRLALNTSFVAPTLAPK